MAVKWRLKVSNLSVLLCMFVLNIETGDDDVVGDNSLGRER